MHKRALDNQLFSTDTGAMEVHEMHTWSVSAIWLTPAQVAEVLPNTSAKNVRDWCSAGKMPGAIQLPSGRWQVPWAAVVGILGFDPRELDAVDGVA